MARSIAEPIKIPSSTPANKQAKNVTSAGIRSRSARREKGEKIEKK